MKNICQRLLLHCTHTTHCYLSVLLYIQHLLPHHHCYYSEAVVRMCSIKTVFFEILQNSQENNCARAFFNKVAGLWPASLLKKRHWYKSFPVNFAKFLRTSFVTEHLWWLLLTTVNISDVCFWFKFKRFQRI